ALQNIGREAQMRRELADAVTSLFGNLEPDKPEPLTPAEQHRLIALSSMAVKWRSAVERDTYAGREIEFVPDAELPSRLAGQLARLLNGLRRIDCEDADVWRVVTAAALDSIPHI